jgi:hypothetical protein
VKTVLYLIIHVFTSKGGSRRAEKSRKVLMMMKAANLGWAGAGAGQEQGWSRSRAGAGLEQEQGRSRARKGRSRAGKEQGRSRNRAGAGQEQGRSR